MAERVFTSLSGHKMDVSDDDAGLLIMSEVRCRSCCDIDGNRVVGPENALFIRNALRKAGFEIVKETPEA